MCCHQPPRFHHQLLPCRGFPRKRQLKARSSTNRMVKQTKKSEYKRNTRDGMEIVQIMVGGCDGTLSLFSYENKQTKIAISKIIEANDTRECGGAN